MKWENILNNINNINKPNKKDFDNIHNYLSSDREELKELMDYYKDKNNRRTGCNIKLCDENGDYRRLYHRGINREKVVFMYASYNRKYFDLANKQYKNILSSGYDGDIIIYFGGYPNIDDEGLKYANLPYSFKNVSLLECQRLGYTYYMWLDCAVLVQKNFNFIFEILEKEDFYLNLLDKLKYNHTNDNIETVGLKKCYECMNINFDEILERKNFSGGLFGINLKSEKGLEFLKLNRKFLDMGTPFFCPCADLAVISGILYHLYPNSDIKNNITPIAREPNLNYFYYDIDH
jgi:hypothetical protein